MGYGMIYSDNDVAYQNYRALHHHLFFYQLQLAKAKGSRL
jgi:hypothetical protein